MAGGAALIDEALMGLDYFSDMHERECTAHRYFGYLWYLTNNLDEPPAMTTFENEQCVKEMIRVPDIPFWSACSHHTLPFFGTVALAYIPDANLLGLSKFSQMVRYLARGLWMQEHLTKAIADSLCDILQPDGLGVYVRAMHTCQFKSLGPAVPHLETTDLRGCFMKGRVRAEFLRGVGL